MRMDRMGRSKSLAVFSTNDAHAWFASTDVTDGQPLEQNSNPILPVPLYRSRTWVDSKSILWLSMLKSASFARSVVGRTGRFFGILILLPLWWPAIIRMSEAQSITYGYEDVRELNSICLTCLMGWKSWFYECIWTTIDVSYHHL